MAYFDLVVSDGASHLWKLLETSGTTAADAIGTATGTLYGSPILAQAGPSAGINAISLNGSSQYLGNTASIIPTTNFSYEMLFKTSVGAGVLVQANSTGDTSAGSRDRHAYFSSDGTLVYGVYASAVYVVKGTVALNDGKWHHLLVSTGTASTNIYVDGALYGTLSHISGNPTYPFTFGAGSISSGWTYSNGGFVNGLIAAPAIYPFAVSASVAQSHAAAALGTTSSNTVTGSLSAAPAASASVAQSQPLQGALSLAPIVAASLAAALSVQALPSVNPGVQAQVVQAQSVSAAASAAPNASATIKQSQAVSGSSAVLPSAAGSMGQSQPVSSTSSVILAVSGSAQQQGDNAVSSAINLTPSASAAVQGDQAISLRASVKPGASGAVGGSAMQSVASMPVTPTVAATAAQSQTVSAAASVVPSLSGRIGNGNAYTVEPDFFLAMLPRAFYLGMPGRSFSVAMPGRSFFIQDEEIMPVQTFPATIDPAEIQPLTIGKSTDLATGETLTALAGALQVEVLRGTDPSASSRFGVPQINAADIPATPPAIPSAVPVGTGLQVVCTNPLDGCWYLLRQPCTTSTGRVVTIKGIIQCTAS